MKTTTIHSNSPILWYNYYVRFKFSSGYNWQEERNEREWCMECRHECSDGAKIRIDQCENNPTRWKFIFHNGVNTVQIKVHDRNLCMEADDATSDVRLKPCSSDEEKQRFVSTPDGAFQSGPKFEITPLHKLNRCLAQQHHPRDGEEIYQDLCVFSRESTTSNWNKYYG